MDRRRFLGYGLLAAQVLPVGLTSRMNAHLAQSRQGRLLTSVLDFIPEGYHQEILEGRTTRDLSSFIQSAVDTGENIFFPGGPASKYTIDGQIQIRNQAQHLFSPGLIRLDFVGTNPNANAIELLSGRRDSGIRLRTRQAQSISGFRLTGPSTASYASMVFVEEGTFFPTIERVFSEVGNNRGYRGYLGDAFLRVNGNTESYVNDVTIRDCVIAGTQNAANPNFPECGIWIEGCIEGRVENTKLFYFDECLRLGRENHASRNVQFMVFDQVQMEPTNPYQQIDGQAALNVLMAYACTFRDCRFAVGNGPNRVSSVAVRISGTGGQIRFRDCSFQGFRRAQNLIEVIDGASANDIVISGGDIRDFLGDLVRSGATAHKIVIDQPFIHPGN